MGELKYPNEIKKIKALGFEPFGKRFEKTDISKVRAKYSKLRNDEKDESAKLKVAGRIRSVRRHGKLTFMDMEDFSGRIQLYIEQTSDKKQARLVELLGIGDVIGVEGGILKTKRGELSILVKRMEILAKAVRALPSEWFGLKDTETRYRQRYLDMLLNPEIKEILIKKSRFWGAMREFLISKGFLEVETPVLENITGGADAKPFVTHHNALDIDVYLRISTGELWQKRLLVGGFEKIFEIGRIFRNEGIDPEHAQDYTQMEFYWAYADYDDAMRLVEEMYRYVAQKTFGTLKFRISGFEIDLGKKWEKYDYCSEVKKRTGIDTNKATLKQCLKKLGELGIEYDKNINLERAVDNLWKYCRKKLAGPGFVTNHPVLVSPLAKRRIDDPQLTERFQVLIAGSEVGNGYSELNDPIDQARRFEEQAKLREAGDEEAQMHDKDFVEALEYGMPPAAGFGVSERLFSFLAGKSIRECTAFPLLKPLEKLKPYRKTKKKKNTK